MDPEKPVVDRRRRIDISEPEITDCSVLVEILLECILR